MGGLIKTKGTKKLAAHFNEEFDTWIAWWRTLQTANPGNLFDGPKPIDLLAITNNPLARHTGAGSAHHSRRSDHKCLLPDITGHPKHGHLEGRWVWFLTRANAASGGLQQANHDKIADGILAGLRGAFDCITFDAVEVGTQQDVAVTSHQVDGRNILQIVLITPPMPVGPGPRGLPQLDP